jgi:hypothetical protein
MPNMAVERVAKAPRFARRSQRAFGRLLTKEYLHANSL